MKGGNMKWLCACVVLLAAASPEFALAAADEAWGKWQSDEGVNIYEFLPENQFRFSGIEKVWVHYEGLGPTVVESVRRLRPSSGQHVPQRREMSGAWETGDAICSGIDPQTGTAVGGNLRLYAETVECCMQAKRLGPTLVLRALSGATRTNTATDRKTQPPEICVSHTLRASDSQAK